MVSVRFRPSPLLWSHIFLTKVHFTGSGLILLFGKWSNYFWKMRKGRKNLAEASSAMLNHYSHQCEFSFQRLKGTAQSNWEFWGRAREPCFSVHELVMDENTSLLIMSLCNFLPGGRQSLTYELSHLNEWHELPTHLWAFGCVDVPRMSYALDNWELSPSGGKEGMAIAMVAFLPLASGSVASVMLNSWGRTSSRDLLD